MIVEFRGQAYYDLFSSFFSRLKGSCGTQKILIKDRAYYAPLLITAIIKLIIKIHNKATIWEYFKHEQDVHLIPHLQLLLPQSFCHLGQKYLFEVLVQGQVCKNLKSVETIQFSKLILSYIQQPIGIIGLVNSNPRK